MKKFKFDILFESVMDDLKDAEVDYTTVEDFVKQVKETLEKISKENKAVYYKKLIEETLKDDPAAEEKKAELKKLDKKLYKAVTEK